jgi:hypothetical protein
MPSMADTASPKPQSNKECRCEKMKIKVIDQLGYMHAVLLYLPDLQLIVGNPRVGLRVDLGRFFFKEACNICMYVTSPEKVTAEDRRP